ncbi:MAG: hypothetical protein JSS82_05225 [Bacteroidetes bacterium]|nr:hypothetical protein [Bacteroidota bacterium]
MPVGCVCVTDAGQGSAISLYFEDDYFHAIVKVEQKEVKAVNGRIRTITRTANIYGCLLATLRMEFYPGQKLKGNILIKQFTEPPNRQDPSQHLLYVDGMPARTKDGKPIYQYYYYTDDVHMVDQLVK